MKYPVSNAAKQATTKCTRECACLKGIRKVCAVEQCISNEVHFIKRQNDENCSYLQSFGLGHLCTCPIRKELFNKHNI